MDNRSTQKEEERKNTFPIENSQSQIRSDDIPDAHASGDGSMGRTEDSVSEPMNKEHKERKKEKNSDY